MWYKGAAWWCSEYHCFVSLHLQGHQFNPELRLLFLWSLTCSLHIHMGFPCVLRFLSTSPKQAGRLIGYSMNDMNE